MKKTNIYDRSTIAQLLPEHHYLLLFAWKIKQGLINNTSADILKSYVEYFYNLNLHKHFQNEEKILLEVLEDEDLEGKKLLFGHTIIREKISGILNEKATDIDLFESLCKSLVEVVKYEEEKFFPYLEEKLNPFENSSIKYQILELDEEVVDNFIPEFWKRNL